MNSLVLTGNVYHTRTAPVAHSFEYPMCFFAFDLAELPKLSETSWLLGFNKWRPLSIWSEDYLHPGSGELREKLARVLKDNGVITSENEESFNASWQRTVLVTNPKFLGYIFNPVSFFLCLDNNNHLCAAVAYVNNTFTESHTYVLKDIQRLEAADGDTGKRRTVWQSSLCKDFHVSPFFRVEGEYIFSIEFDGKNLDVKITMKLNDTNPFSARLVGEGQELNHNNLSSTLIRYPLTAVLSFPRIVRQAKLLWWNKKLPWITRPAPQSPQTIRHAHPGVSSKLGQRLFLKLVSRLTKGQLQITLPDHSQRAVGAEGDNNSLVADLRIHDHRFFSSVIRGGEIGFCESFVQMDCTSSDIEKVLRIAIENESVMQSGLLSTTNLLRPITGIIHRFRQNTKAQARRNIHAHYDIGNEFYRSFLDERMVYSAAYFETSDTSLEDAQLAKIDRLLDKLQLNSSHKLLEIGCGWGALTVRAAKRFNCQVTAITISEEQYKYVKELVKREGVENQVAVKFTDYRELVGNFDRIVSVEMLEAVGKEFLAPYFSICDKLLAPGGRLAIQTITMNEQHYKAYCSSVDWIRYSIFPGGHLPSLSAIMLAVGRKSELRLESSEDIGLHYAETLRHWHDRFISTHSASGNCEKPGSLERRWILYLAYCEAAFRTRYISTHQMIFNKSDL